MPPKQRIFDRATVRDALVASRVKNLASFRAYQKAGVFPSNTFSDDKLNVWRDDDGHYCAAATIIRMSGQDALVERVAEQDNFIRLADVKQGPVMEWILTSGFTQAEIAMIQEPFDPVTEPSKPAIDPKLRAKETARLKLKYQQIDRELVTKSKANLDAATDLLMKHPDLAEQLIVAEGLAGEG